MAVETPIELAPASAIKTAIEIVNVSTSLDKAIDEEVDEEEEEAEEKKGGGEEDEEQNKNKKKKKKKFNIKI